MKNFILLLTITICAACSEKKDTDDSATEDTASNTEVQTEKTVSSTSDTVENYAPEIDVYTPSNEDGVWQIDDYAESILGSKIYKDVDSKPEQDGSIIYYQTLDLKGGYAVVTGPFEGYHEFALWRTDKGYDVIGKLTVGCGPVCDYESRFFERDGEHGSENTETIVPWDEINKHAEKLLPRILETYKGIEYSEDHQIVFNLPQKGTSMEVDLVVGADEVRVPILNLGWNKSEFYVLELYEELNERAG